MPKVLIHGATGIVGKALAQALVRSGNHKVFGLARTEEKGHALAALEIHPVVCPDPIGDPSVWTKVLREERIDLVVDAASYNQNSLQVLEHVKEYGKEKIASAQEDDIVLPQKVGFVYISGGWVHGDSMESVSDIDPVGVASARTPPMSAAATRPSWEQAVLKSRDVIDVAICRPSIVYGATFWVLTALLNPVLQAKGASSVNIPTIETSWPSFVHVEDLAAGIRGVIERLQILNSGTVYPVFNFAGSQENMSQIVRAAAKALHYNGELDFVGPGDDMFLQALTASFNFDSSRARMLLGWDLKKVGVMRDIGTYVMTWKANLESKT
ncbi:MAG: hypothetical protein Q9162_001236 [Coniocarpon cinnabarinum]